jgi:pilus assembly protein CpaB
LLNGDSMELVPWPGAIPIDGAFSRPSDVVGREVLFPLSKGQPILDRDLSAPGSGTGLASRIPDGMRAVALRSDEVVGVAGFLIPGSRVDVLVTYHSASEPDFLTATVLQHVVVLAVGQQIEPDPTGKPSDVTIVTLLLNPEQSQRAVLASAQGAIHFVLRNGEDGDLTETAPAVLSRLSGKPIAAGRTSPRPAAAPAPVATLRHEIETILGGGSGEGSPARTQNGGAGQ